MSENKTINEVMTLLNITTRQNLYHKISILDLGETVKEFNGKRHVRVFTPEQVQIILNAPISKGGRGHKRTN